jgi:Nucleotide modification associated domain 3
LRSPRFLDVSDLGSNAPMKIVFSRKGFDSGSGGAPSPIVDGTPVSLPIPTQRRSLTPYANLGLADIVERVTRGRITGSSLCHYDPMFESGRCAFGQTGAAQAHLQNNGVTSGDVFLFFGLFSEADGSDRHHRIFGYLEVACVHALGARPGIEDQPEGFSNRHPHTIGEWNTNNTLYVGSGCLAAMANPDLRLSKAGKAVSSWRVPPWLRTAGLTYHARPDRWVGKETLNVVGRGQEFVTDISNIPDAKAWLERVRSAICRNGRPKDRAPWRGDGCAGDAPAAAPE